MKQELVQVSVQENGAYFIYKIPKNKIEEYCKKEGITLEPAMRPASRKE